MNPWRVLVCVSLASLTILCICQQLDIARLATEQERDRKVTKDLAATVLMMHRANRDRCDKQDFEQIRTDDAFKRTEEILGHNIAKGKLELPKHDAKEWYGK